MTGRTSKSIRSDEWQTIKTALSCVHMVSLVGGSWRSFWSQLSCTGSDSGFVLCRGGCICLLLLDIPLDSQEFFYQFLEGRCWSCEFHSCLLHAWAWCWTEGPIPCWPWLLHAQLWGQCGWGPCFRSAGAGSSHGAGEVLVCAPSSLRSCVVWSLHHHAPLWHIQAVWSYV